MPGSEVQLRLCREWVTKTENDLITAAHTLKLEDACPTDTVCFHAQQCVEKYLDAPLVLAGRDFPRTHDLVALNGLLDPGSRAGVGDEELARMTTYGPESRYPGSEEIPLREARAAVALARRLWNEIRRLLPRGAKVKRD